MIEQLLVAPAVALAKYIINIMSTPTYCVYPFAIYVKTARSKAKENSFSVIIFLQLLQKNPTFLSFVNCGTVPKKII